MLFLRLNRFDRNNLECMNVKDWMPRPQECFGSDLNSSMQAQIGSFSQSLMCLFATESSSASIQVLLKLYVLSSNEICEVMNSFKILSFVWAEISKLFVTFNKDFNFVDKASLASSFFIVKLNILPKYVKESPIVDGGNGVLSDENGWYDLRETIFTFSHSECLAFVQSNFHIGP